MSLLQQAIEWRKAFGHPIPENFDGGIEEYRKKIEFQMTLIGEEYGELEEAVFLYLRAICVNDFGDGGSMQNSLNEKRLALLKEMADAVFVVYQLAAFMGLNLDEAMNRVFSSNMSKLDNNGRPIYNESGKVMKGPNYIPPNLDDII